MRRRLCVRDVVAPFSHLILPTPHTKTHTPKNNANSYYKLLLKLQWAPDERYPKLQYRDQSGSLMMLPSDLVLVQDAGCVLTRGLWWRAARGLRRPRGSLSPCPLHNHPAHTHTNKHKN